MKAITSLLLLVTCQFCFASGDTNIIAVSDWSQPVATQYGSQAQKLRARMLVMYGRGACLEGPNPETQFYLELCNVSCANAPMQICFDPMHQLSCALLDASGKPVATPRPGAGAIPERSGDWITLPNDSTIRLRVNSGGYGSKKGEGLNLYLWPSGSWYLRPGDTNSYYLTGTFTVTNHFAMGMTRLGTPRETELFNAEWSGTIELPKMKISVPKP
jgi:hypothetical protein